MRPRVLDSLFGRGRVPGLLAGLIPVEHDHGGQHRVVVGVLALGKGQSLKAPVVQQPVFHPGPEPGGLGVGEVFFAVARHQGKGCYREGQGVGEVGGAELEPPSAMAG